MTIPIFLAVLLVAFVTSAIACFVAMKAFPFFRSGERKAGAFRPDQSAESYRIETRKGSHKIKVQHAGSTELPAVGGPAILLGIVVATVVAAYNLSLSQVQWEMLGVLLFGMVGFGVVGFVDDWRKVHKGEGISEIQKFAGVLLISLIAGVALNRLLAYPAVPRTLSARLAYPPYSDFPLLGQLLKQIKYAWIVFFLIMTAMITTATALAVDFSDGMDGLCGGLMFSAALSLSAILLSENDTALWPGAIAVLAIAGATAGFLPFNWPSSWKARNQGVGRRRAHIIMGDSGSLALGGLLALVAIISRLEFVLLFIGGVFVLEGLSALISARILVRFFRKFLRLERYNSSGRGFLHTEFPLPFLATPMHHHYDLLGWDRKRLVYAAWLLGTGLGVLGVASVIGTFTWQRYLARFAALLVIVFVWQTGPWTRSFFIGLHKSFSNYPPEAEGPVLALYYGYPFRLFGRRLYGEVDTTSITAACFRTPAEQLSLWQRMSVFDARSVLGYYCYREGAYDDALRIWSRIPKGNLQKRAEISEMLDEARHTVALHSEGEVETFLPRPDLEEYSWPAAHTAFPSLTTLDPSATVVAGRIPYSLFNPEPPAPSPSLLMPAAALETELPATAIAEAVSNPPVVPVLTPVRAPVVDAASPPESARLDGNESGSLADVSASNLPPSNGKMA
ncbi:MAG: hypothetical protein ACLQUY_25950 [Ktedonobacterales bacterium]